MLPRGSSEGGEDRSGQCSITTVHLLPSDPLASCKFWEHFLQDSRGSLLWEKLRKEKLMGKKLTSVAVAGLKAEFLYDPLLLVSSSAG